MPQFELVHRAAVVDILLAGFFLGHQFASDKVAAIAAANQTARIGQFMRPIGLVSEQHLHAVPCRSFDDWLVFSGKPILAVAHFTDVAAISQDRVQRSAGEAWC